MLSNLFNRSRGGESGDDNANKRTDRFLKKDRLWYFKTREGFEVGPFQDKSEAQYALLFFVESSEWPTGDQLSDFIEGCKLNAGLMP